MSSSNLPSILSEQSQSAVSLKGVYRRITFRLIPFLMLLYLIAFLDRVNVGFAALTMNSDLGISNTVFGLGAGIFFFGYFLFEVPSNFMLVKVGARIWIAVLMILTGVASAGLAFVHSGPSYMLMRFLLGAAEAGFFPGVVLYLTFWLPASVRGGLMALFIVAIPLSTVVGAPFSIAILGMNNIAGLLGWQWLFLIEGGLALFFGAMVPFVLSNGPQDSRWLSAKEQVHLLTAIRAESPATPAHASWTHLLRSPMVLGYTVAYFTLMVGVYSLGFWVPRILDSEGLTLAHTGWITAIPYLISAAGMVLWCRHSDSTRERTRHLMIAFLSAAMGMYIASATHLLVVSVTGFSLAALGIFSAMPLFWATATEHLGGNSVAGIALINSLGNFGGFVGPVWMGWVLDRTHSFSVGLLSVAITLACGAILMRRLSQPVPLSGVRET